MKSISKIELAILAYMTLLTLAGVIMSYTHPDYFRYTYTVEDGFIEWLTVLALAATMVVCFQRAWLLRQQAKTLFLAMTILFGLAFLFGAGEEISWGQRIFNVESPEFFKNINAQGETNLHNIIINDTKINKLVFGKGIGILLIFYLAVFIPLYRYQPRFKNVVDKFAIPIATNYQIAAYLIAVLLIQVGMDSSKKGELLEFTLTHIFLLNFAFAYNREIFQAKDATDTSGTE
ncbi:MAG: hypothetical protein OQL16_06550 [Gammaproteobacteria bacterium]|nr:hypothetical protein [Gammaproteobacteria bacterium]